MDKTLKFEIGQAELVKEISDSMIAICRVKVCHDQNNSHNMPINLSVIKEAAENSLRGKPILYEYIHKKSDFGSHSPNQIPAGYFIENQEFEYVEENSKTYLVGIVALWKDYAQKAYEIFLSDNHRPVSMEMRVIDFKTNDLGQDEITGMIFQGVTILGQDIQEACKGADIEVIKFADRVKETEQLFKQFSNPYSTLNFSIPSPIQSTITQTLTQAKSNNLHTTAVSLSTARYLSKNQVITPDKVKYIAKQFAKYKSDPDNPVYNLYGGFEGLKWANDLHEAMIDIDNKMFDVKFSNSNSNSNQNLNLENESIKKEVQVMEFSKTPEMFSMLSQYCGNQKFATEDNQEMSKYSMLDYCSNFMYAIDNETKKMSAIPYTYSETEEEKKVDADFANTKFAMVKCEASDEEVDMAVMMELMTKVCSAFGAKFASDDKEEDKKEEMADKQEEKMEEKKEDVEEKMADDSKEDSKEEEKEDSKEDAKEDAKEEEDKEKQEMSAKFEELNNKLTELENEAKELREFKSNILEQEKQAKIEFSLNEVNDTMPKEKVEEWRNKVNEFDNVDAWSNALKAEAFTFAKGKVNGNVHEGIKRMGLPYSTVEKSKSNSVWKNLIK